MTDEERPLSGDANGGAEREANTDLDNIDDYSRPLSYMREMEQDSFQPQRRPTIPEKPPEQFRELPKDQGFTVQALMEGAMLVAISLLLAVIGIYAPVISIIGLLLYPLPMAVLTMRRGVKVGVAGTVALLALSAIFFGIPQAVLMLLQYGVLGVFLGWCLRSGRKPLFTLGIATLIAALGAAAAILLSLLISGLPLSSLQDQAREMVNSVIAVYQQYGMIDSLLPEGWTVEQYSSYMEESMMRLLPAVPPRVLPSLLPHASLLPQPRASPPPQLRVLLFPLPPYQTVPNRFRNTDKKRNLCL